MDTAETRATHRTSAPRVLLTIRQFADRHPAFSQGALRNLIFNAKGRGAGKNRVPGNGLDDAIVRLGRRVLIDEAGFFLWLDRKSGGR